MVVYHWDEATGAWLAFFPGLEDVLGLNTLTTLEPGTRLLDRRHGACHLDRRNSLACRPRRKRVLFSCRSFDLEQDARLRALVGNQDEVERIRVGLLDEDAVRSAIDASGLAVQYLSQEQLQVLSTPLHLYLFLEASRYGEVDFRAPGDLFDAFWSHKGEGGWGSPGPTPVRLVRRHLRPLPTP